MSDSDAIREVVEAHQFKSTSTSRKGFSTHHAGCSCDPDVRFDWYERDAQYREHLYAAIYTAARLAVAEERLPNGHL